MTARQRALKAKHRVLSMDPALQACNGAATDLRRMVITGRTYRKGRGVPKDYDEAKRKFDKACSPAMKEYVNRTARKAWHPAYQDPDRWDARVLPGEDRCAVCGHHAYKDAQGYVYDEDGERHCVHEGCDPTGEILHALEERSGRALGRKSTGGINFLQSDTITRALTQEALRKDGALIDVTLHADCEDGSKCAPQRGKALIDPGADRSAVATSAMRGARQSGVYRAQGVTSEAVTLPVHSLRMEVDGGGGFDLASVPSTPHLESQGLIALFGRDALAESDFRYHGPSGTWSLETPGGMTEVGPSWRAPLVVAGLGVALGAVAAWLLTPSCPSP